MTVNGTPAAFELRPAVSEELPDSVTTATYATPADALAAVGDAAFFLYERVLQREREPELVITLPDEEEGSGGAGAELMVVDGQQEQRPVQQQWATMATAVMPGKPEAELCVAAEDAAMHPGRLLVRVEYSSGVGRPQHRQCGLHFGGGYAASDSQVRRASAWLPCADLPTADVRFGLAVTVRAEEVAAVSGRLLRQTWADASRRWRTFHFVQQLPCAPHQLAVAAGHFAVTPCPALPGSQTSLTLLSAPDPCAPPAPPTTPDLPPVFPGASTDRAASPEQHTAAWLTAVLRTYQGVLGAALPLPALQVVLLPPGVAPSPSQATAGACLLTTGSLVHPACIEAGQAAREAIAAAAARLWFGVLLRPATPADAWLAEGEGRP